MGGLENGPHADGKGLLAGVALAEAGTSGLAVEPADAAGFAAERANRAVRPQVRLHIGEGCGFVLEVRCVENWSGHGGFPFYEGNLALVGQYVKCNVAY